MVRWISILLLAFGLAAPAVAEPSGRVRVIDADTMDVGGTRVRLFGIDAPEIGQPCRIGDKTYDCGLWAADFVRQMFDGKRASCDWLDTDRHGRTVARCAVGGMDMGAAIVDAGFATAFRRYSDLYVDVEKGAVAAGRGIFGAEMISPEAFRAQARQPAQAAPGACRIKGNISDGGRIYHLPGQENYDRTRISESRGERWFCTEAEARQAGWRRARR